MVVRLIENVEEKPWDLNGIEGTLLIAGEFRELGVLLGVGVDGDIFSLGHSP